MSNWNDSTNRLEINDPEGYKNQKQVTSWDLGYNGVYPYLKILGNVSLFETKARINEISAKYTRQIIENHTKAKFEVIPITDII